MDDSPIFNANVVIENNRIVYIGNDISKYEPFDLIRDCHNNLLMPGFKNCHTHSAMTFMRSKADEQSLHDWLFNEVFPREQNLREDDIYWLSKLAFLEYIANGETLVCDQYFFPLDCARAAKEMGMRMLIQITFSPTSHTMDDNIESLYHEFNDPKESLVRFALGMHAEYTGGDEDFRILKELVHKLKAPFYTHISESENEVKECIQRRNMTPVQFFDSLGMFDYGGGCYHCVHFTDEDIEIFKKRNLSVISCPGSNSKLASGVAPLYKYQKAGLNIALGTDGAASNNSLDMFKEMTLASFLQKLMIKDPVAIDAYDILKMATINGSKALGMEDTSTLEVGKLADIIEINLSSPCMQPFTDIVRNIVYAGNPSIVSMTMINGKILYDNGHFDVGENIQTIYDKCQEISDRLDAQIKTA